MSVFRTGDETYLGRSPRTALRLIPHRSGRSSQRYALTRAPPAKNCADFFRLDGQCGLLPWMPYQPLRRKFSRHWKNLAQVRPISPPEPHGLHHAQLIEGSAVIALQMVRGAGMRIRSRSRRSRHISARAGAVGTFCSQREPVPEPAKKKIRLRKR